MQQKCLARFPAKLNANSERFAMSNKTINTQDKIRHNLLLVLTKQKQLLVLTIYAIKRGKRTNFPDIITCEDRINLKGLSVPY